MTKAELEVENRNLTKRIDSLIEENSKLKEPTEIIISDLDEVLYVMESKIMHLVKEAKTQVTKLLEGKVDNETSSTTDRM